MAPQRKPGLRPKTVPADPDRLVRAMVAYFEKFDRSSPVPYGVSDDTLVQYLERAVRTGKPNFNGHSWLPPGADA
jgi:hypothetical protein